MAVYPNDSSQVMLNEKLYNITDKVRAQLISQFPGKVITGDSSYDNQLALSPWIIRSPFHIGVLDMDEKVDANMCWWTNLITDYEGHLTLPRLATEISTFNILDVTPTWTAPTAAVGTDWENPNNARDGNTGTYATSNNPGGATWTNYIIFTLPYKKYGQTRFWVTGGTGAGGIAAFGVDISDGDGTWTNITSDIPATGEYVTINHTDASFSQVRIRAIEGSNWTWRCYEVNCETADGAVVDGTLGEAVNFNGNLYWAKGKQLVKLQAGRASFTSIMEFEATITALVPSLNNRLYIFLGDSYYYCYMNTSEAFTQSNSANANWGFQYDDKLFKVNTSGACAYSSDPDDATPTWASTGAITDIASQIESFFIGKDADGADIPYCATNTLLKALSIPSTGLGDALWVDTSLRLPNHPNGGKGAVYWHDGHYIPSGLDVLRYVTGSTASISNVGLSRRGGLPVEYNGEIVKLCSDGINEMFALVDASQTSGNSLSGLYAYDGQGWRCWWIDTANNGAMYDVIVSSAASSYAAYWAVGGKVYYTDIHRGIRNTNQLPSTQEYAASGAFYSPIFDGGTAVFNKLAKRVYEFVKDVTSASPHDETIVISYRQDHTNTDIATGWTTLIDLDDAATENGQLEQQLASNVGVSFNTFQFRIQMTRGTTTTDTPDLLAMILAYKKDLGDKKLWSYSFTINLDDDINKAMEKYDDLITAAGSELDITFNYHYDSERLKYVSIEDLIPVTPTGPEWGGLVQVRLLEV